MLLKMKFFFFFFFKSTKFIRDITRKEVVIFIRNTSTILKIVKTNLLLSHKRSLYFVPLFCLFLAFFSFFFLQYLKRTSRKMMSIKRYIRSTKIWWTYCLVVSWKTWGSLRSNSSTLVQWISIQKCLYNSNRWVKEILEHKTENHMQCILILILVSELVRANMGSERVPDIQKNDDSKESRASTASFEYDRAEVWSYTCIFHVWSRCIEWRSFSHGRNHSVSV